MTLLMVMANEDYVISVSDRRLTVDGQLRDDESNKAAYVETNDARVAVGYTGLATAGSFKTQQWLLGSISASALPDHLIGPLADRLGQRATAAINSLPWDPSWPTSAKRLTILLAGFHYAEDPPRPFCFFVSNFERTDQEGPGAAEPWPEFEVTWLRQRRPVEGPASLVQLAGAPGVSVADMESLAGLLKDRRPANAVVGKAVEVLRSAAESPASMGLVGKQCSSIVVPWDAGAEAAYHSDTVARTLYMPDYVNAREGHGGLIVMDSEFAFRESEGGRREVMAVPKVGRNEPCPCGSGKKYKRCHGRPGGSDFEIKLGG